MKKIVVILWLFALIFPALTHSATISVLDYDNSGVTVEVIIDTLLINPPDRDADGKRNEIRIPGFEVARYEGQPVLPVHRYLFEVTSVKGVSVSVIENNRRVLDGVDPVIFHNAKIQEQGRKEKLSGFGKKGNVNNFVTLAGVGLFRKAPIALVDIRPVIFDKDKGILVYASRIVFRLTFPPAAVSSGRDHFSIPRDRFIVNAGQAKKWRTEARAIQKNGLSSFEFDLADTWVKIRVEDPGIYQITYSDLFNRGVNPANIDPSNIRIFSNMAYSESSRPFQQPENINLGGSFEADYQMAEHAIQFIGNQSGSFDPGESVLFYGVGVEGWSDYLDPEADRWKTYDNIYETRNVYWMAWGSAFAGNSKRMEPDDVTPSLHDPPDLQFDTYEKRLHIEEDKEYAPYFSYDRWCWRNLAANISGSYTDYFTVTDIADTDCRVRTIGMVQSRTYAVDCYLNTEMIGSLTWKNTSLFPPDTLLANASSLENGSNTFRYQKTDIGFDMNIYWYEIFFDRYLKPDYLSKSLDFFAPETTSTARFILSEFPAEKVFLFDISEYYNPVILNGAYQSADTIIFDDDFSPDSNHYYAVSQSGLRKATIEYIRSIPSLRNEILSPVMLVIYNNLFSQSAQNFANYRSAHFPDPGSGYVKNVDIEDVYNNFSGGLKDPIAIRNYLRFLYDNYSEGGEPVIEYVFLIGKGNYDPKDIMGRGEDYIPYYFEVSMESDDFLVKLDDGFDILVDLAIGRLPVLEITEANGFVEKLIGYEEEGNLGSWRDKVVFVADDEHSSGSDTDIAHIRDTEELSTNLSIRQDYLDINEIYLHDYPTVNSLKPGAKADLMAEWNEGALVVNYLGHGSPVQLADELVMIKADIYSLTNGNRLPLFLAFSCSVGDLDQIFTTSLAHEVVLVEGKGAIASIAAVVSSYGNPNRDLDSYLLDNLFPSEIASGTEPVGRAFLFAKMTEISDEWNNKRYALIGDPSMKLMLPDFKVEHVIDAIDTLYTGRMYNLRGSVMVDNEVHSGFNGSVDVVIREAKREYNVLGVDYDHHGSVLFRGTADVSMGEFSTEFVVPLRCHFGNGAKIRSYVTSDYYDGAGCYDASVIIKGDSIMENDGPPQINMYFENNATKVKKGSKLLVEIKDENGIAIIGMDPQNSIFLEFDESGYPIYVTDYFEYDYGSFTSGIVEYPLHSEFERGSHRVVARVFDNLGEMSRDTLDFDIVEEGIYRISDIFNFPNPFSENTNFVFQLSGGAKIHLRVFTVSGVEIWGKENVCMEGFNSIYWDGKDHSGNRIGNGTYLYMLDAEFYDSFNRSETAEGKVILMR